MRSKKAIIMKTINSLLCFLLVLVLLGCLGKPMSCEEMKNMDFFPERLGDKWIRSKVPKCHDYIWGRGYIHALYEHTKKSGYASSSLLKVWIIDKVSPQKVDKWLMALLNGTHTSSTIRSLYKDVAEIAEIKEFYREYLKNPITIMDKHGYERIDKIEGIGGEDFVGYKYYLYYTHGRFVIGIEDFHFIKDLEEIRREAWALLKNLNLPH